MYTLVVVDLQDSFCDNISFNRIKNNVLREIQIAKRNNNNILVLRYVGCGPISSFVRKAIVNYRYKKTITKCTDDGSLYVNRFIEKNNIKTNKIRVVGVNISACVWDTVVGLREMGYDVVVPADCCDNVYYFSIEKYRDEENVSYLKKMIKRGVKVIRRGRYDLGK